MTKKNTFLFRMDDDTNDLLNNLSKDLNLNKSEVLREALKLLEKEQYLEHPNQELEAQNKNLQLAVQSMNLVIKEVNEKCEILNEKMLEQKDQYEERIRSEKDTLHLQQKLYERVLDQKDNTIIQKNDIIK